MKSQWSTGVVVLAAAVLVQACARGGGLPRVEDIPRLEREAAGNTDATVRLGGAYVAAKRYEDARRVLTPLVEEGASNSAAFLYLGIANEELQDFTAARTSYEKYIANGRDARVKDEIRGRLALVVQKELKQQAKAIIAREQVLSQEPPTPRTVAVLPFRFNGATEELQPLQSALADMMITDLSVSRAIVPVERVRIQALIDEMLLGQAGITDGANTTRAGRLLKAEHIVQGAMTLTSDRTIRVDGAVLATAQGTTRGPLSGQNAVEAIFDLEKDLVFRVFSALQIELTAAERERINENRTGNLLAFLAYGRGLQALDRGNYSEATQFFNQATQLDPQFSRAEAQRDQATQLNEAVQVTTDQIAIAGVSEIAGIDVVAPTLTTGDILKQTATEVNYSPSTQMTGGRPADPTGLQSQTRQNGQQEAIGGQTGGVQQALKATITINIKRPGT